MNRIWNGRTSECWDAPWSPRGIHFCYSFVFMAIIIIIEYSKLMLQGKMVCLAEFDFCFEYFRWVFCFIAIRGNNFCYYFVFLIALLLDRLMCYSKCNYCMPKHVIPVYIIFRWSLRLFMFYSFTFRFIIISLCYFALYKSSLFIYYSFCIDDTC